MKTRILSAVVGIVVLMGVLFCPYTWIFSAVATMLAMVAVWELLHNTGLLSHKCLLYGSILFSGAVVLASAYLEVLAKWCEPFAWILFVLLVLYSALVVVSAALKKGSAAKMVALRVWNLTLYATVGFLALVRLRLMENGLAYVLLPLVISWMSDTGAYFIGSLLGKHKMAPIISPKKTWEGFFGGWVISVGSTALFGLLYQWICQVQLEITPWQMAALAVPLAPLSVCGDLLASKIKRQYGIKDYGNIMPGHGGVMDRFDSVILIAPILYILLFAVQFLFV